MRSSAPPLIDLEAFEAAARLGSFVAAAGELHLSPSAVSHRVRALEQVLGVRLFVRFARRIELTDQGRAYLPFVRRAFDELSAATVGLFGSMNIDRRLTVRAPISFAVRVIAPHLHHFVELHPDIEVRLVSAIWADSLPPESTDMEILYSSQALAGPAAQLLCTEVAGPVWAPAFEQRYGPVGTAEDLSRRPQVHVLGYEVLGSGEAPSGSAEIPEITDITDVTVDTSLAAIELVSSGRFSAMLPLRFVDPLLEQGVLRTDRAASMTMSQQHYVVFPDTTRVPAAEALLFLDWLRSRLG